MSEVVPDLGAPMRMKSGGMREMLSRGGGDDAGVDDLAGAGDALETQGGGGEFEQEKRAVGIEAEGGERGAFFQVAGAELAGGAFDGSSGGDTARGVGAFGGVFGAVAAGTSLNGAGVNLTGSGTGGGGFFGVSRTCGSDAFETS